MKPDAAAQFRSPPSGPYVYMGGTTISCGQHPTTPKRHRWGPWEIVDFRKRGGSVGRERTCKNCGLVSDISWLGEKAIRALRHSSTGREG